MASFSRDDLVNWVNQRLPSWQQDALRRILQQGDVSENDVEELGTLAKAPHQAQATGGPSAVPAVAGMGGGQVVALPTVTVSSVRDIDQVNALGKGPVPFGKEFLTVLYGCNGSGKSGITRILKKACQAREPGGAIRANVFQPSSGKPATATIDFVDGATGQLPPSRRSRLSRER